MTEFIADKELTEDQDNHYNDNVSLFLLVVGILGSALSALFGIVCFVSGGAEFGLIAFGITMPIMLLVLAVGVLVKQLGEIKKKL